MRAERLLRRAGPIASISLGGALPSWTSEQTNARRWDGFVPDVELAFDERGFDHRTDGTSTGWRAFAYYPLPGAFLPTNGSADDVLIRLDSPFREREDGQPDMAAYEINLAVVEALVTRTDVPIDSVDEAAVGVDLDLDGRIGTAKTVAYDDARDGRGGTRMHYVGRARLEQDQGMLAIAPGLFPVGTEIFHTVRYLDVREDGIVGPMASRRGRKPATQGKVRFLGYEDPAGRHG